MYPFYVNCWLTLLVLCRSKGCIEMKKLKVFSDCLFARTDKTLAYQENQEHLSKLWDILAVYGWIDKDVG
ncbi:hypothetical protein MKX03_023675 [Papaver bracteatum]|nr:hypothetical protein MKX03_023675 [Papaver bracteatum]